MKRSLLAATLIVAAAGVASANLLTSAADGAAPVLPQAQAATPAVPVVTRAPAEMHASVPAAAPVIGKPAPTPAPVVQKASVETRQAPVPLLMKPRPAVSLPALEETAAGKSKAPDSATEQVAATEKGGEAAAKAAAEADGYKGVKILRKGVNGVWHASALRGQTPVMLTVDPNGSVSTD